MYNSFVTRLVSMGYSENTGKAYLTDLKLCEKLGIITEKLEQFNKETLLNASVSPATKRHWYAAIVKYAKYLIEMGVLTTNPIPPVILPKLKEKLPKTINYAEFIKVIDNTDSLEIKTILSILYSTGCRIDSLSNLKIEDISDNQIIFRKAKGDKPYISVLTNSTKDLINQLKKDRTEGYLFPNAANKKRTPSSLRMLLYRKMGSDYINPHTYRHSIATELVTNGTDIYIVKDFLNHSSVTTTMKYVHLSAETKRRKLENKHPMIAG